MALFSVLFLVVFYLLILLIFLKVQQQYNLKLTYCLMFFFKLVNLLVTFFSGPWIPKTSGLCSRRVTCFIMWYTPITTWSTPLFMDQIEKMYIFRWQWEEKFRYCTKTVYWRGTFAWSTKLYEHGKLWVLKYLQQLLFQWWLIWNNSTYG